jgi:unsaturated rhamnogalacturonyl hydrolase
MSQYFPLEESINYRLGDNVQKVLNTVANRYIGQNPEIPVVFRAISRDGFVKLEDGRYNLNLKEKYPDAKLDQYAYIFGMLWSNEDRKANMSLSCYGPTRIFVNNELFYKSDVAEDVNVNNKKLLQPSIKKGWNTFLIKLRSTSSGFGCIFGSAHTKWNPVDFMSPFTERYGQGGLVYSEVYNTDILNEKTIPDFQASEYESVIKWFPRLQFTETEEKYLPCRRIFGVNPGKTAYCWSSLRIDSYGNQVLVLEGMSAGDIKIWLDNKNVLVAGKGNFREELVTTYGEHSIFIESVCEKDNWGFTIKASVNGSDCEFKQVTPVKGTDNPWLYLGPFDSPCEGNIIELQTLYRLFRSNNSKEFEGLYWRIDSPNFWVRPYIENNLFGKWNYPLGVTLYGLLQTGRLLNREDIKSYVISHISECTKLYEYSVWDKEQYGYPALNHQLVELNMLDDCGSIGSAMLEAYKDKKESSFIYVADRIANYMKNKQERKEDGAFYRLRKGDFCENTLWADDLYMSTPFLVRYYRETGEEEYINDAVKQFLLFKQYLFIEEYGVMSHVYDFKYDTPTFIPWGRGNGWVIFSLTELLEVLPKDHKDRPQLVKFFNELAEGFVKLQGKDGLWHQVLTHPDSYEETSCTAMFTYAFSRGVRLGLLEDVNKYVQAIYKAWDGITRKSIDKYGNIHGVCMGSRYSFTPEYYKEELLWNLNDTHGIGIVMLCGIEVEKLQSALKESNNRDNI